MTIQNKLGLSSATLELGWKLAEILDIQNNTNIAHTWMILRPPNHQGGAGGQDQEGVQKDDDVGEWLAVEW